jgi:putative transcriptional regulator
VVNLNTVEEFAIFIAGEIVLSSDPGKTIKKWRELVGISQSALAASLKVSPSVISDYERSRRSPGSSMVKRIAVALVDADKTRGGNMAKSYSRVMPNEPMLNGIIEIKEFISPIKAGKILQAVRGEVIANGDLLDKDLFGYTILDSVKAILELSMEEFYRIYGMTSERALIFTRVSGGRSPFIAIKVSGLRPGMVVLHGLDRVDPLGVEIAERERILLILSTIKDVNEMAESLRRNVS